MKKKVYFETTAVNINWFSVLLQAQVEHVGPGTNREPTQTYKMFSFYPSVLHSGSLGVFAKAPYVFLTINHHQLSKKISLT